MFNIEKYKNLKLPKYSINNTDSSLINSKLKFTPINFNNNYNPFYSQRKYNQKNENINNCEFSNNDRFDNLEYINNSLMDDISNNKNKQITKPLFIDNNKINRNNSKNPIYFNNNNSGLILSKNNNKLHSNKSYNNINMKNNPQKKSLFKNNSEIFQKREFNKLNNIDTNKIINNQIDNNQIPFKRNIQKNEILDKFQNNNFNGIYKSKSNVNIYKKYDKSDKNKSNSIYSKKNLKINPNKIKEIEIINNIKKSNKTSNYKNINLNSNPDNYILSQDKRGLKITKSFFEINNKSKENIKNKNVNNNLGKKKNNKPSIFIKKNNLPKSKRRKNISFYNTCESLNINPNNTNNTEGNKNKEEENLISINSLTKYNTQVNYDNMKSGEDSQINNLNKINIKKENKPSLLSKMKIDTNLTIDDEMMNNYYKIKFNKNIDISSKTIFTLYSFCNKIYILCFDYENRKFSLRDFADFGNFEENYKLSFQSKNCKNNYYKNKGGNLFLSKGNNLYIVTGKNYDMLYVYDSVKKSMNKLCNLKNNHSNGALIDFNDNSLLCISGDYNKKVELFSISKNEWNNYLSETLIERSNFPFCIIKQRYIFLIFGKNFPTNEYLNTIEYYDLNIQNDNGNNVNGSLWKYLNFKNENNLIKMNICNGYGINFNDKKIVIFGGYNGLEEKDENCFIQIILENEDKLENDIINCALIERTERKLKDIDKNKKYYFNEGGIINNEKENNNDSQKDKNLFFAAFDNSNNCHFIQNSNLAHDIYYNNLK